MLILTYLSLNLLKWLRLFEVKFAQIVKRRVNLDPLENLLTISDHRKNQSVICTRYVLVALLLSDRIEFCKQNDVGDYFVTVL